MVTKGASDRAMVTVSVNFDHSGDIGMVKVALWHLQRYPGVVAVKGRIYPENPTAIQFTLADITDRILPALRRAEENGDALGLPDIATLHHLREKFEEAVESADV